MTTAMRGSDLGRLCDARGWSRSQLLRELRSAAAQRSEVLPGDDSLRRMTRQWVNGDRGLSPFYVGLLATVFGTPFAGGRAGDAEGDAEPDVDLAALIARSTSVDATLIDLLEAQTDQLRALDTVFRRPRRILTRCPTSCATHSLGVTDIATGWPGR
jgi:hypothetical protein